MAKNGVDGVYNADPKKDKTAVKFDELSPPGCHQQGAADYGLNGFDPVYGQ